MSTSPHHHLCSISELTHYKATTTTIGTRDDDDDDEDEDEKDFHTFPSSSSFTIVIFM